VTASLVELIGGMPLTPTTFSKKYIADIRWRICHVGSIRKATNNPWYNDTTDICKNYAIQ
jgi:hypothetical protein